MKAPRRRTNKSTFMGWKRSLNKSIFKIALFQSTLMSNSKSGQEANNWQRNKGA
jgi:hypothetical protein